MLDEQKAIKALADELIAKGTVTLTSKARDDIYKQAESLTASLPKDVKWTRSCVEYHPGDFSYSQTYTILKQ